MDTAYILSQGAPPESGRANPGPDEGQGDYLVIKEFSWALEEGDRLHEVVWGDGFFALCMHHSLRVHEAPDWDCTFRLQHTGAAAPPWFPEHHPYEVAHGMLFGLRGARRLLSKQAGIWAARLISSSEESKLIAAAAMHPSCSVTASAEMQEGDESWEAYAEARRLTLAFGSREVTGTVGGAKAEITWMNPPLRPESRDLASLCWLPDGLGYTFWLWHFRWVVRF